MAARRTPYRITVQGSVPVTLSSYFYLKYTRLGIPWRDRSFCLCSCFLKIFNENSEIESFSVVGYPVKF
jgi:hypothetical protein